MRLEIQKIKDENATIIKQKGDLNFIESGHVHINAKEIAFLTKILLVVRARENAEENLLGSEQERFLMLQNEGKKLEEINTLLDFVRPKYLDIGISKVPEFPIPDSTLTQWEEFHGMSETLFNETWVNGMDNV